MLTNVGQLAEGVDNSYMHMLGWLMPNASPSTRAIRQAWIVTERWGDEAEARCTTLKE
jgi:hypothetical protein